MTPVIDACWIHRPAPQRGPTRARAVDQQVMPDGCIDLIFRSSGAGGAPPRLFTSALIEQATPLDPPPEAWFVGVRFRPGMSRVALSVDPADCRDRTIRAAEIDAAYALLEEELAECRSPDEALSVLRRRAEERIAKNARWMAPPRVRGALSLLADREAGSTVAGVARSVGISERSLHRELVSWTGLGPKVLGRIFRMQAALKQIRSGTSLAAVAHETGYADQAHMTREVRHLTGLAPSELGRTEPGR